MEREGASDPASFPDQVRAAQRHVGKRALSNDEILALAAEALSHTFTREEIGFGERGRE